MRHSIALLLLSLGVSGTTDASNFCENCTTQEMFNVGERATLKIAWNRPHPPVYVTNFSSNTAVKVGYANNVDHNFDWEFDLFQAWGVNLPVESQVFDYVATVHAALPAPIALSPNAFMTGGTSGKQNRSGVPESVYDSISTPSRDRAISSEIHKSAARVKQTALDWLKFNNPIPGFNPNAHMPLVRANFADGTYAYYEWDIGTQLWKRKHGSARDVHDNIIPENVKDVAGEGHRIYEFVNGGNTPALAQFLYRLRELGVSVGTAPGTGTRTRVACSSAGNEPPVCRIMAY
ncbi:hypothetical protein [Stenotrophomonas sp.]|uniref:hypothetical protein n=1 Tax=Stenotrophomonas sp. TaxID=69392 RepID=UPI00289C9D04|nr:hypothetical protein [Stenotrophomonas sp.]